MEPNYKDRCKELKKEIEELKEVIKIIGEQRDEYKIRNKNQAKYIWDTTLLQRENKNLKSQLKTAEKEIKRLRSR